MEVRTLEADIVTFLLCEIIADAQSMEVVMTRCLLKRTSVATAWSLDAACGDKGRSGCQCVRGCVTRGNLTGAGPVLPIRRS